MPYIVICEPWNSLEQDLMHDSCKQTPQDSWSCGSAAEYAKIQGWKSSDTLPKRIIIEFIQLRCVSAIIDVAVLPVRILLIFVMSWFFVDVLQGMAFNCVERVKFYATQLPQDLTGMAQALQLNAMNPAAPKVHSFFFTRKSVGVSQSWATAGTPYAIHILIQISSIVHAYSYSFLQNELMFIGGMKSGKIWDKKSAHSSIFHADSMLSFLSESLLPPQEAPRIGPLRPPQGWPSRGVLEARFSFETRADHRWFSQESYDNHGFL